MKYSRCGSFFGMSLFLFSAFRLGISQQQFRLTTSNYFFCIVQVEDTLTTLCYIQFLIACQIRSYISQIWQVSLCIIDTKTVGVCRNHILGWPKIRDGDRFLFLRNWGLCHNWVICNAFLFNGRHEEKVYLWKLKGVQCGNFLHWNKW